MYWEPHLRCSKEFQSIACATLKPAPSSFTILGAGRLLDFPDETFLRPDSTVHLVDADPALGPYWRRCAKHGSAAGATVIPHFTEITGRLESWTTATRRWLRANRTPSTADLVRLLDTLPLITRDPLVLSPKDVVVSLNLLSQIPIYWRERLLGLIRSNAPQLLRDEQTLIEPIEHCIRQLARMLQQEHLDDLALLGRRLTIIISDVEFYYYRNDQAAWQVEPALHGLALPQGDRRDSWYWHIAPQGIEEPDYGAIHKVQAVAIAGAQSISSG